MIYENIWTLFYSYQILLYVTYYALHVQKLKLEFSH